MLIKAREFMCKHKGKERNDDGVNLSLIKAEVLEDDGKILQREIPALEWVGETSQSHVEENERK